jgi:hypothetical protein
LIGYLGEGPLASERLDPLGAKNAGCASGTSSTRAKKVFSWTGTPNANDIDLLEFPMTILGNQFLYSRSLAQLTP